MCYLEAMMTPIAIALVFLLPSQADGGDLPPGVVAAAGKIRVTESEYFDYVVSLLGKRDTGRELIQQMVRETAIKQEMSRRNLRVSARALEARSTELDKAMRQHSGGEKGLMEYIEEQGVGREEFFEALRLSIAHETMARSDFDMDANEAIDPAKLNLWLKELLSRKKVEAEDPDEGAAAVIDGETIENRAFGKRLAAHIGREKASNILTELIGIRLILARADELGLAVTGEDVDSELREREAKLQARPGFETITYANFLEATSGQNLEDLTKSDKFRAEILMKKLAQTLLTERDLARFFEKNRESFERRFGEAARVASIFLKAARFPNKTVNRSFDDAVRELEAIRRRIEQGEAVFENMARIYSEHESGKQGGDLGFLGRNVEGFGEIVAECLAADEGALLGPFKTTGGCHLVRALAKRGPVVFAAVRDEVARDARQDLYRSMLDEAKIQKSTDPPPHASSSSIPSAKVSPPACR